MRTYPKIETLFNRDPVTFKINDTSVLNVRRPEFGAIDYWVVTEKIDGTNIRIDFRHDGPTIGWQVGGRTDKAQIQTSLVSVLHETADAIESEVIKIMNEYAIESYTLFGEGYGPGIQKGGGLLSTEPRFTMFDVLVNDRTWLSVQDVQDASRRLNVEAVAGIGQPLRTNTIIDYVLSGITSQTADDHGTPDTPAEGVVCHPVHPLYDSRGNRVVWKLKAKDFA